MGAQQGQLLRYLSGLAPAFAVVGCLPMQRQAHVPVTKSLE
jgi:hypothetical protein